MPRGKMDITGGGGIYALYEGVARPDRMSDYGTTIALENIEKDFFSPLSCFPALSI